MRKFKMFFLTTVVVLLAACGGTTLKISPESASTTASGDTITLTASGGSGVTWSLSPELGSLSATSGASVTYTPPERVESTQTVTVTASSGGASASATITVDPLLVDVSGVVLNMYQLPASGVNVAIPGKGKVTTDASGAFTFDDVIAPYDVIVENGVKDFWIFAGLTKPDPLVFSNSGSGWLSVDLSGTISNTTNGNGFGVQFVGERLIASQSGDASASNTSYSISATMLKPTEIADGYALEWTKDADGNARNFAHYGSVEDVELIAGQSYNVLFGTSQVTSSRDLALSVSIPSGTALSFVSGSVSFGEAPFSLPILTAAFTSPASGTFTLRSPGLSGAKMRVLATTSYTASSTMASIEWYSTLATSGGVALDVAAAPAQLAPADGASDVTFESEFSWEKDQGTISVFAISGPVKAAIFTDKASAKLPDLSEFGLSYASGDSYTWTSGSISAPGLYENVDQLTAPDSVNPFTLYIAPIFLGVPITDSGYLTKSPKRSFTIR